MESTRNFSCFSLPRTHFNFMAMFKPSQSHSGGVIVKPYTGNIAQELQFLFGCQFFSMVAHGNAVKKKPTSFLDWVAHGNPVKNNKVCIRERSTPASLSFKGLVAEHGTVKCIFKIYNCFCFMHMFVFCSCLFFVVLIIHHPLKVVLV